MNDNDAADILDTHSPEFIDMAFQYGRMERVTNPDGYGKRVGDCGDTVEMFLTVADDNIIEYVSLAIDGCVNTIACANTIGEMVEGKSIDQAWTVTPESVAGYLKTLADDHFHCAELACGALFLALTNYRDCRKKSWKKNYKRL